MSMLLSAHKLNQVELETRDVARVEQRILIQDMDERLAQALQDEEDAQTAKRDDGDEESDAKLARALQEDEDQRELSAKASLQQQVLT
jgi:hypothetical protein